MKKKKIAIFVTALVLVCAILVTGIFVIVTDLVQKSISEKKEIMMNNELISSGLVASKIDIEHRIAVLSNTDAERVPTVTFLYRTPNRLVCESVMVSMSDFSMTGTICISNESMPGDEGNMTLTQYRDLIEAGYSSAVAYDGSYPLDQALSLLKSRTEALGIDFPKVLYVFGVSDDGPFKLMEYDSKGKPIFTQDLQSTLDEYGVLHVVQDVYEKKSVGITDFENPFVYCEAIGFNASSMLSRDSFMQVLQTRGALVFSVGFEFENNYGAFYGAYEADGTFADGSTEDDYYRMLDTIYAYGDRVKIISVEGVGEYREDFAAHIYPEIEKMIDDLRAQLKEIDVRIQAIKDKYK